MFLSLVQKVITTGIRADTDKKEIRFIKLTNIIVILAGAGAFAYIPYLLFYLPESSIYLLIISLQFIFYLPALYLNHLGFYFTGRCVLCFTALAFTVLESVATYYYCDIHLFLLIGVVFSFFVFPEWEKKFRYFMISCFAVSYVVLEAHRALNTDLTMPPHYIVNLRHVIRIAFLVLLFFSAYYSYMIIRIFEKDIENKNDKMEAQLDMARKLQEHLIPSHEVVEYISSFYKPMGKVGGDFYDFIYFGDTGKIGIFISDVSGHGVSSAFITSMIKTAMLQSGKRDENPSELLAYLNDVLIGQTGGYFITAFYGIYDPGHRSIEFSNAGHNPPYIVSSSQIDELRGSRGLPLTVMNNYMLSSHGKEYTNHTRVLPERSKLILYTDGLVETRSKENRELFFEYGGLQDIFINHSDCSSESFISGVYRELVGFHGSEYFEDDICIICLNVK